MFTLGSRELIVGLGSNSDDSLGMLRRARKLLRSHPEFRLVTSSAIYQSDALLPAGAPPEWNRPFLNAACRLEMTSDHSAEQVVTALKAIERTLGRREAPRWAPRAIDLDLLVWGKADVANPQVTVPHAGLASRPFALLPALDCVDVPASSPELPPGICRWRYSAPEQIPERTRVTGNSWSELMAVLNLTPDSFSDGGRYAGAGMLEEAVTNLVQAGVTLIDVGAESTRPGATPLSPEQEIGRLEPALETLLRLKEKFALRVSLDSRHAATVSWALERGLLSWINDVGGLTDPLMLKIARRSECPVVVMHSLGVPPRSDVTLACEKDPVAALIEWGNEKVKMLAASGIDPSRVIIDPGVGFGKTAAQNLAVLERAEELHSIKAELLIGHSRKRFLDPENLISAAERDLETAILTSRLAKAGVDYLRVHEPNVQARALKFGARLH